MRAFLEFLKKIISEFLDKTPKKMVSISKIPESGDRDEDVTKLQVAINEYFNDQLIDEDGIFGENTFGAVQDVQLAEGLQGSGYIGPKTLKALGLEISDKKPAPSVPPVTNYQKVFEIAKKEIGVTEIVGGKHNPRVLEYHATTGKFSTDEVSWCGSFVSWCLKKAGFATLGADGAGARNWLRYGKKLFKPVVGCIVVFWRVSKTSWQGHVAFYSHESENYIYCLGGNQGNTVKISAYSKSRLLGYRGY